MISSGFGRRVVLLGCLHSAVFAATKAPVGWSIKTAPTKPLKPAAKFDVVLLGRIDPGWHLYALTEPEGGPVATEIALTEGDPAALLLVEEAKPTILPDPVFQKPTGFFTDSARFTLHLQVFPEAHAGGSTLHVLVRYQSCNDRVCLPPRTESIEVPVTIAH